MQTGRNLSKTVYKSILPIFLSLFALLLGCFLFQREQEETEKLQVQYITKEEFTALSLERRQDVDACRLMLEKTALPYDRESDTYFLPQNMEKEDFEGILSVGAGKNMSFGLPEGLYLFEDAYMQKKQKAIGEGHIFEGAVVFADNAYLPIRLVYTGMPAIVLQGERKETPVYDISDIDAYVFDSEERTIGTIDVFMADGNSGTLPGVQKKEDYRVYSGKVSFHGRGNTSNDLDKKGYALHLLDREEKTVRENLFGLGQSSKYKLLAGAGDSTKVKEKVAWQLWEEIASSAKTSEHTTTMEYCEVFMDDAYIGLYQVIKAVNEETLGLGENQLLYKVIQEDMPTQHALATSIENGYEVCNSIRIRYPDKEKITETIGIEEAWEPVRQWLKCFNWKIDFNVYRELMDMENLTDYYIFLQGTTAMDNATKNTYRLASRQEDGSYRMQTLPWDLNYTFGDVFALEKEVNKTAFEPDITVNYQDSFVQQLYENNACGEMDRLRERWKQLRKDTLSDAHVLQLMQDNMDYMTASGAFQRDSEKWPWEKNDEDLSQLFAFQRDRMQYLDTLYME